jgi:hypothetical protein
MRANREDFGDVVFLDMMKRQLSIIQWTYAAIVLLDGERKLRLAKYYSTPMLGL